MCGTPESAYTVSGIQDAVGGSGGEMEVMSPVKFKKFASHDIVAADAWAATLFGLSGADVGYVRAAAGMGLGTMELEDVKVEEISV